MASLISFIFITPRPESAIKTVADFFPCPQLEFSFYSFHSSPEARDVGHARKREREREESERESVG